MKNITIENELPLTASGQDMLNTICGNILFTEGGNKVIAIVSCHNNEGKTYLTLQIAKTLASVNKKIIVIDTDFYDVKKCKMKTQENMAGLLDYMRGKCSVSEIIYKTNIENVYCVPQEKEGAISSFLYDDILLKNLLKELSVSYDLVLIDTPAAGRKIDATKIAGVCDGAILVVQYNKTKKSDVREVMSQFENAGCQIIGCIINKVKFDSIISKKRYRLLRQPIRSRVLEVIRKVLGI